MKTVLLIGDSIRMGYDKSTAKTLSDVANVYFPDENCRFAAYVLRNLPDYRDILPEKTADVVHWNAGLWDCLHQYAEDANTPLEIYTYYIERVCARIKNLFPNATVIFATSTSVVTEEMPPDFKRYNSEIEQYNAAATEIAERYGFEINDLYALSTALPPEAHSDSVHYYTPIGTKAFTDRVVQHIGQALGLDEIPVYQEELYTDKPIGI